MRRPASVLLCAVFLGGLAACGGAKDKKALPETVEGTTPTTTTTTPTTTTKTATTTTPTTTTTTTGGGSEGKGDATAGKKVFATAGCASCHTLADAGAKGTIGPNLDQVKPPHDLVVERVTNGMGVMPSFKDQLSEKQIQDVAAYVSQATSG
jgi:cytochrome c6